MYTTFGKTDSGLRITLTDAGRSELAEQRETQTEDKKRGWLYPRSDKDIFFDLIEDALCNGWESLTPEQLGALTSNPYMLADDCVFDDDGELEQVGTVYAYDAYQISDPLDLLEQDGSVFFDAHREG